MKFILSFSVIFLTLLEPTVFGRIVPDPKTYLGYPIEITDAPWMAFLRYMTYNDDGVPVDYLCGGTIVDEMHILTAGHCVTEEVNGKFQKNDASRYEIRVGSTHFDKGGTLYKVAKVIPHPSYTSESYAHDVGILKLAEQLVYDHSTVEKVQLDTTDGKYKDGEPVLAMGWGTNPDHPDVTQLFQVNLNIVEPAECARRWQEGDMLSDYEHHEICALGPENASVCPGDSGGPLCYGKNRIQIGITSFGATCAENDRSLPNAFAKIADNLDWINGVISGKH